MHTHAERTPKGDSRAIAHAGAGKKGYVGQAAQWPVGDNKSFAQQPVQRYKLGTGQTRMVTLKGANDSCSFEECHYNYVEYNKGDARQAGTGTSCPANWAGWVKNKKGDRNATQLHVVNNRWGGLGGKDDKNIVPGSPAENSHHYHQAETVFDDVCFGGSSGKIAKDNCKYECWATPSYSANEDVSNGDLDFDDPKITVTITDNTGAKTGYPVLNGAEGLALKDGS